MYGRVVHIHLRVGYRLNARIPRRSYSCRILHLESALLYEAFLAVQLQDSCRSTTSASMQSARVQCGRGHFDLAVGVRKTRASDAVNSMLGHK